jgi:hypothetical protein
MGKTSHTLTKLAPHHKQAARLLVSGLTATQVSDRTGHLVSTISSWKSDPLVIAYINKLERGVTEDLMDDLREARTKLLEQLVKNVDRATTAADIECTTRAYADAAKVALDAYKVISAQTGIAEKQDVSVTHGLTEAAARALMAEEASRLPESQVLQVLGPTDFARLTDLGAEPD